MDYIKINLNELIDILNEYDIDMSNHTPLDNIAFANYIYNVYQPERSKREDIHKEDNYDKGSLENILC
jgi:hypothetical protein